MESLKAHSHNSVQLNDRILWFDGDSTVEAEQLINRITSGKSINSMFVQNLTNEILQYNCLVPEKDKITIKKTVHPLSFEWNIPAKYKKMDVVSYIADKFLEIEGNSKEYHAREQRCVEELKLYKKLKLFDALRTIIYIINTLEEKDIVWGVGRGSSVSSYVLYLIGVHDIDSFFYGLNIEDFLRNE